MDDIGWQPCRLLPFDGSSAGAGAGPQKARCTYAAWSPDDKWMYFSADTGDGFHLWRQRFPNGSPQQITFGPTEEEGIAVAADGRSLVTSAGIRQGSVWLHDAKGDRQISSEGFADYPREFRIFALVRRSRNLLISPFKSGNRSGQVPGTSDASQTQSVLTGS
jgi:hypothetical protein